MCVLWIIMLLAVATTPLLSCSSRDEDKTCVTDSSLLRIRQRGTLLVGTTGDYRPLSFLEADGHYWGFGIELAQALAQRLGVEVQFVPTTWPTLTDDVNAQPACFDMAMGGITITPQRQETMLMSEGYLANGKTILCRADEASRFGSLADIDRPEVTVMINPGGTNEKFAHEQLSHAKLVVHERNEEIPTLVAQGEADVMVTEITEAPYYIATDTRLAAPLLATPFTNSKVGVLMRRGQDSLLGAVNTILEQLKADSTLRRLHKKYGLVYSE